MICLSIQLRSELSLEELGRMIEASRGVQLTPYLTGLVGSTSLRKRLYDANDTDVECSTVLQPDGPGQFEINFDAPGFETVTASKVTVFAGELYEEMRKNDRIELKPFKGPELV